MNARCVARKTSGASRTSHSKGTIITKPLSLVDIEESSLENVAGGSDSAFDLTKTVQMALDYYAST
jgi:hypothetical protein